MIVGISELGEAIIGSSATATSLNTTAWELYSCTYTRLGLAPMLIIGVAGGLILITCLVMSVAKTGHQPP